MDIKIIIIGVLILVAALVVSIVIERLQNRGGKATQSRKKENLAEEKK